MRNVDPFEGRDDGLFASEWDFKVCVSCELTLMHALIVMIAILNLDFRYHPAQDATSSRRPTAHTLGGGQGQN